MNDYDKMLKKALKRKGLMYKKRFTGAESAGSVTGGMAGSAAGRSPRAKVIGKAAGMLFGKRIGKDVGVEIPIEKIAYLGQARAILSDPGVAGGLSSGVFSYIKNKTSKSEKERDRALSLAANDAVFGFLLGRIAGNLLKRGSRFKKPSSRSYKKNPMAKDFEKAKTKSEARNIHKNHVMKTHPDKGGSTEEFNTARGTWEDFKASGKFDKLAFLQSRYDSAFEKEAGLGKVIPKSMTKTRNVAASAVKSYRKNFRRLDKNIISQDQVKSKVGKKAIAIAELPGKSVKSMSKKVYLNPDAIPAAAVGSMIPIPGGVEATVYGYLKAKRALRK